MIRVHGTRWSALGTGRLIIQSAVHVSSSDRLTSRMSQNILAMPNPTLHELAFTGTNCRVHMQSDPTAVAPVGEHCQSMPATRVLACAPVTQTGTSPPVYISLSPTCESLCNSAPQPRHAHFLSPRIAVWSTYQNVRSTAYGVQWGGEGGNWPGAPVSAAVSSCLAAAVPCGAPPEGRFAGAGAEDGLRGGPAFF